MTKKNYIEFAKMMSCFQDGEKIDKADLVMALSDLFHRDNGAFDRERFEAACKSK